MNLFFNPQRRGFSEEMGGDCRSRLRGCHTQTFRGHRIWQYEALSKGAVVEVRTTVGGPDGGGLTSFFKKRQDVRKLTC
jgi:hypothetical protein